MLHRKKARSAAPGHQSPKILSFYNLFQKINTTIEKDTILRYFKKFSCFGSFHVSYGIGSKTPFCSLHVSYGFEVNSPFLKEKFNCGLISHLRDVFNFKVFFFQVILKMTKRISIFCQITKMTPSEELMKETMKL